MTELCTDLPGEFLEYMNLVKSTPAQTAPDYERLRQLFESIGRKGGFEYDGLFDWVVLRYLEVEQRKKSRQDIRGSGSVIRRRSGAQVNGACTK